MTTELNINGTVHEVDAPAGTPLLWVLRDYLNMYGTKFGCGVAQCGACTVHIDGQPTRSCVLPHDQLADSKISTIEGIESAVSVAVKNAWESVEVPQCGYCQSGQIMSATALLSDNPNPSDDAIDTAMSGNICRCATYPKIRAAIKDAAKQIG